MNSNNCELSQLDLFSNANYQTSIIRKEQYTYSPLNTLDNGTTLEFFSPGTTNTYRDLSNIYLNLKLQILKGDGSLYKEREVKTGQGDQAITTKVDEKTSQPGFINNILHSIFRSVEVQFNGEVVSNTDFYHLKSYVDIITNFSSDAIETNFAYGGFSMDDRKNFDTIISEVGKENFNSGLALRKVVTDDSNICDLYARVNVDIFNQSRPLTNNVDLKISFQLENANFYIMEKEKGTSFAKIHEAKLTIHHLYINPNILLAQHRLLSKNYTIKMPYVKSVIKTQTIAASISSITIDNLFQGPLPINLMFFMIDNTAFSNREKTPLNFQPFNLSHFGVYVNGQATPIQPLEINFNNLHFAQAYTEFLKNLNVYGRDKGIIVKRELWNANCFMIPINFSPTTQECLDTTLEGTIRFELKFAQPLAQVISAVFYAEYNAMIEIDKHYRAHTV